MEDEESEEEESEGQESEEELEENEQGSESILQHYADILQSRVSKQSKMLKPEFDEVLNIFAKRALNHNYLRHLYLLGNSDWQLVRKLDNSL